MNTTSFRPIASRFVLAILFCIACINKLAYALEFECTTGDDQRFIRLEIPGENHLCEVSVTKIRGQLESEHELNREVKWYANKGSTFCTTKTYELKGKYENVWGFSCTEWPDTDGIDSLSIRHRLILDAELKKQIDLGKNSQPEFTVKAVKATASASTPEASSILALQFFNFSGGQPFKDVTHIIKDDGTSWVTRTRVSTLASYVPSAPEYQVNSALISAIDSSGTLEISTMLSENKTSRNCYGAQAFLSDLDGRLIPRTPHRFVCK